MLKSSGFMLIAKLFIAGLNFATIIIISRWLGPVERGICSWYLVVIAVCLVFSETIAGPTAGFLLRKYPEQQIRYISYLWAIITSMSICSLFLAFHKISGLEWGFLCVLCWLNAANSIHLHLLLASLRLKWFNALSLFIPVTVMFSLLAFFLNGFVSRTYYLCSLAVAWSVAFLIGIFLLKKPFSSTPAISIKPLLRDGFRNGMANQASHLAGLLNSRLIFFMLPATVLGIYSNALSLAEATMMIPGSMGQVMYASLLNEKDPHKSSATAKLTWWLTLLLLIIVFVIVLLIPDQFYQLIFGHAFAGVKHFLSYLSAAMIFYGSYLVMSYWQSANGWFIRNFYATLAALVVNGAICLVLYFTGNYHIMTGIWALAAGFFTLFLVAIIQFGKKNTGVNSLLSLPGRSEITEFAGK